MDYICHSKNILSNGDISYILLLLLLSTDWLLRSSLKQMILMHCGFSEIWTALRILATIVILQNDLDHNP